jgi:Mrp family chromosome partitioning ATPase
LYGEILFNFWKPKNRPSRKQAGYGKDNSMTLLIRIIPTSFIRWVENLPEWFLMAGAGCFILLVIVAMLLVIRKLNSQDSPSFKQTAPSKPPVIPTSRPAAASVPKMPAQPASAPVPRPQPAAPVQPAGIPVPESRHEIPAKQEPIPSPKPAPVTAPTPVSKPLPTAPIQSAPVPASEPSLETPAKPASQQPPVLDPSIYNKIAALGGTNKSVLFAGAGLEHLPVTIPVQTGAKLAAAGKKVLLIDLDMKRNAIVKVFDPTENTIKNSAKPRPLPSPVENLSFWPAEFFVRFGQMNLRMVIQSASSQFEIILINAPYLDGHPDRKLIASCAKYGLIFCNTKPQFERLQTLMTQGECQLLESKPIEC